MSPPAHQGVIGMTANARERLFWPGINASIRQTRSQCKQCNEHAPTQSTEPMLETMPPEVPFQQVVTDLCSIAGHDFLIYADRYSGWIEVAALRDTAWKSVKQCLLRWFATYGVPEEISSAGGPPYNSTIYTEVVR